MGLGTLASVELTTAILSDFSQVRDGLLFVVAGGIRRVRRPSYPAPLGASLALVVELDQVEMERGHQLEVRVVGPDGEEVAKMGVSFQVSANTPLLSAQGVPLVINLHRVMVPAPGAYDVRMYIDGHHQRTLRLTADIAQLPAGAEPPDTDITPP